MQQEDPPPLLAPIPIRGYPSSPVDSKDFPLISPGLPNQSGFLPPILPDGYGQTTDAPQLVPQQQPPPYQQSQPLENASLTHRPPPQDLLTSSFVPRNDQRERLLPETSFSGIDQMQPLRGQLEYLQNHSNGARNVQLEQQQPLSQLPTTLQQQPSMQPELMVALLSFLAQQLPQQQSFYQLPTVHQPQQLNMQPNPQQFLQPQQQQIPSQQQTVPQPQQPSFQLQQNQLLPPQPGNPSEYPSQPLQQILQPQQLPLQQLPQGRINLHVAPSQGAAFVDRRPTQAQENNGNQGLHPPHFSQEQPPVALQNQPWIEPPLTNRALVQEQQNALVPQNQPAAIRYPQHRQQPQHVLPVAYQPTVQGRQPDVQPPQMSFAPAREASFDDSYPLPVPGDNPLPTHPSRSRAPQQRLIQEKHLSLGEKPLTPWKLPNVTPQAVYDILKKRGAIEKNYRLSQLKIIELERAIEIGDFEYGTTVSPSLAIEQSRAETDFVRVAAKEEVYAVFQHLKKLQTENIEMVEKIVCLERRLEELRTERTRRSINEVEGTSHSENPTVRNQYMPPEHPREHQQPTWTDASRKQAPKPKTRGKRFESDDSFDETALLRIKNSVEKQLAAEKAAGIYQEPSTRKKKERVAKMLQREVPAENVEINPNSDIYDENDGILGGGDGETMETSGNAVIQNADDVLTFPKQSRSGRGNSVEVKGQQEGEHSLAYGIKKRILFNYKRKAEGGYGDVMADVVLQQKEQETSNGVEEVKKPRSSKK